jgi:two-component system, chemotaxis family, CheB/CheR fusion protein
VEKTELKKINALEASVGQLQNQIELLQSQQEACYHELEDKNEIISNLKKVIDDHETFVYMVSHDLKSAVTNMLGLLSLIESSDLKVEIEDLLPIFRKSAERVNESIQDISQLTQLENNEVALERVDLSSVIQKVLENVKEESKISQESIEVDLKVREVRALRKHLLSILYNLLNNSIKYKSPQRFLLIKIESYKKGEHVVISVQDNGVGIQEEHLTTVFNKFQRFNQGHVEGSGLGLYIVNKLVENLGGWIEVSSELGVGSKFSVYLKDT